MHRPARTLTTVSAVAALAFGLTACGGSDDVSASPPRATVTVTETPEPTASGRNSSNGGDDARGNRDDRDDRAGGGSDAGGAALSAAARTALGAVDGTVVNVDREPTGWEVDLVAGDGSETRVDVSADGGRVLGQRAETEDAEDLAENQRLLDARVDWPAALQQARTQLQGDVDEIDLGEDDGRIVWEVSLPGDGPGTGVVLDADTGEVLGSDD